MQPGVIIVSNRLPVSVKRVNGKLEFYPSVGGLATGLSSYANNRRNKWIGWPGLNSDELTEDECEEITHELKKHNCYPVFLSQKQLDDYYNGFSNSILWPAFHELPVTSEASTAHWNAYKQVNNQFCEAVLALSTKGSTIWVHDYQLLLLPSMLRQHRPSDKIGFFLHIPFPRAEPFQNIPHHVKLLNGLIGADLLGFHTESYVENFLACCQQTGAGIIGDRKLLLPDRVVRVTDFPMGIDYGKFARATKQRSVRAEVLKLKAKYGRKKIVLTVDRLDPTKGLVERLEAYRDFLRHNPSMHGKVVMVMLAVPSRTEIAEYQALKKRLEKLVKDVNKEFGTIRWQPVDYMFKSVPFDQLTALYRHADVAFIAPIKDGMNLVAKEYLATKPKNSGVLILSETAGAAEELKDAIIVNPHEKGSLQHGLTHALMGRPKELRERARSMQHRIANFTVHDWAGTFMNSLQQAKPSHLSGSSHFTHHLSDSRRKELLTAYEASKRRVLLFDYDGVLAPFRSKPADAKPDANIIKKLHKLSDKSGNHVVLISGRPSTDLQDWFGDSLPNVTLIAEHGAFARPKGGKRWRPTTDVDLNWKEEVQKILETYTAKTPGSTYEAKEASVVWHYRRASPYYAQKHLVIVKRLLNRLAKQYPILVEQGNMILEVRTDGVHKGSAALDILQQQTDFILAIGDDVTDEDMFEHLPGWAYTIKVGRGRTAARFRLSNVATAQDLLSKLARK